MIIFFRWIKYLSSMVYYAFSGQIENDPKDCKHSWWVYSTAIADGTLEVECLKCKALGAVYEPTSAEWSKAYDAPDCSYRWREPSRVKCSEQEN